MDSTLMRRKVTESIREWYESGRKSALLVEGARQVGKTFSIDEFCRGVGCSYLYVDFSKKEFTDAFKDCTGVDSVVLNLSSFIPGFLFKPNETIIFFDEIQECPDAIASLKQFAVDGRYRVIASGSLLGLSMSKVRLVPMGYVEYLQMGPMDFEEFLWSLGLSQMVIDDVRISLSSEVPIKDPVYKAMCKYHRWYLAIGGMPAVVKEFVAEGQMGPVIREHEKIIKGQIQDIRKHAPESIMPRAEACFRSIPSALASENKKLKYSDVEKLVHHRLPENIQFGEQQLEPDQNDGTWPSVGHTHYERSLDWLNEAHVILTCRRLTEPHMPLDERVSDSAFKLYVLDPGILLSMYDSQLIKEVMTGNTAVNNGAIEENYVASAFRLQGRELYYVHQSTGDRLELDFVTVVKGKVCAIEVRSGSNTRCRSLNKAMEKYGVDGIMFETRNCFTDDKGVRHYPMFAASFMDAIDPVEDITVDLGSVEDLNREFEHL